MMSDLDKELIEADETLQEMEQAAEDGTFDERETIRVLMGLVVMRSKLNRIHGVSRHHKRAWRAMQYGWGMKEAAYASEGTEAA